MTKDIGLWIDHRQAILVTLDDKKIGTKRIASDVEKKTRNALNTDGAPDQMTEIRQDRRFDKFLGRYYDEITEYLQDADSIVIFGPGEAKGELQKTLEEKSSSKRIRAIDTADNMTVGEVVAKVREYFQE